MKLNPILIFLIVILMFEICKFCSGRCEAFTNPGDFILSISPESSASDRFVQEDVEILVGAQKSAIDRVWKYEYARGVLGKYIGLYTRKIENGNEIPIQTILVKNTDTNNKILNLFGFNKMVVYENIQVNYYIKFLSQAQYNQEMQEQNEIRSKRNRFNICMNSYKGTISKKQAEQKCKSEIRI